MIPLIKKLDIDEINTSLIAIRKLLNNVGITETNITNIVGKDYDAKIQELEEKVEAGDTYSTTEHWTGRYWINGKKIYSKVLFSDNPPPATGTVLISNVDEVINAYGYNSNEQTSVIFPYWYDSIFFLAYKVEYDSNTVICWKGSSQTQFTSYKWVFEYTKTTN